MPLLVVMPHEVYPSFSADPLSSPQVIHTTRMPNRVCGPGTTVDCYLHEDTRCRMLAAGERIPLTGKITLGSQIFTQLGN